MSSDAELEAEAEEVVNAALNGDPEAIKELLDSGVLDDDEDEAEATEPPKPPAPLCVNLRKGETDEQATARTILCPTVQAALSSSTLGSRKGELDLNGLVSALEEQVSAVQSRNLDRGEEMLTAQAHTLDLIFNELLRRAALNMGSYLEATDTYLKLCLRAQSQCRSTWEAISAIQNPPVAGYVKQANIAHGHQQVNNGPRAEEFGNPPSKLLEEKEHEQWLDRGTPAAAERADSEMEAVGEIDGAKDRGR